VISVNLVTRNQLLMTSLGAGATHDLTAVSVCPADA
jgi:hypothetical protein